MNGTDRLDFLLSDILKTESSTNGITQGSSIQPLSPLTFTKHDSYPSPILPSAVSTATPSLPRRDASSLKNRRRRNQTDQSDNQKQYQPLLNSSTLDDLFRALTLECEQYLAASSSYQNKTYGQMIAQPSSTIQAAVESNDEDYENLHTSQTPKSTISACSPLKTSIEVMSPIKRHVVSISISSKISSKIPPLRPTPVVVPPICHSSEKDLANTSSTAITNRKQRRRRARKQLLSSTTTRSSSSSTERKDNVIDNKKPIIHSKRSYSTDPRYQRTKSSYDNKEFVSSSTQKQPIKRPRRRDISLQHSISNSSRFHEKQRSSPLSVLLTSTSDFLDNSYQRQSRRSRLESIDRKPSTLLDRMHQQFYRPPPTRNNTNNIPTHRTPSYPVY